MTDSTADEESKTAQGMVAAPGAETAKEEPAVESSQVTKGESIRDQFVVSWDGDNDPTNPRNWSWRVQWGHIMLISMLTFVTSLGSSMLAPAVPQVMASLHSENTALDSFVVSVYVIGSALGPLGVSPASELYGRATVYHVTNVLFLGCTVGCALSTNVGMFIAFRFLSGFFGVTPLALGGGSIGDIVLPEGMGIAMAVWGLGSLVAPVLAPIAGGYLSEGLGWRWVFWIIVTPMGLLTLLSFLLLRESYGPIILERKAARLRKQHGDSRYQTSDNVHMSGRAAVTSALVRPVMLLFTSPIVFIIAVNVAVVYGYMYLVFTTLSYVFNDEYNFSSGLTGLTYLGNGIGTILGIFVTGAATDIVAARRKRANKPLKPEFWLWPVIPANILVAAGLFWYGWSTQAHAFPVVPLLGLGVFGFGVMAIFQPVQIFLVNTFPVHSASALAASNLLRSVVGGVLPLGGQKLYSTLGYGWGNSLLAFIALGLTPLPVLLMRFGERLREGDRNVQAAKMPPS